MLEKYLIDHCAPTLASLKTANLFSFPLKEESKWKEDFHKWKRLLKPLGIFLTILKKTDSSLLVYLYRIKNLYHDLENPITHRYLQEQGYENTSPQRALMQLKKRLVNNQEFPHEIGFFLGYPPEDVVGFISHCGQHSKYSGCWKVYGNQQQALRQFARYKRCREVYSRLWKEGRSVLQLTVAA